MHAGTFNSNPIVMAASAAALGMIRDQGESLYDGLRARGRSLMDGISEEADARGVEMMVEGPGPVFQTYMTDRSEIRNYRDYATTDDEMALRFHYALLDRGVNTVRRGLWFLSTAHDQNDVDRTLEAVADALDDLES
jgi:glutamate-1-semialdehyde 2,1-aminomutase